MEERREEKTLTVCVCMCVCVWIWRKRRDSPQARQALGVYVFNQLKERKAEIDIEKVKGRDRRRQMRNRVHRVHSREATGGGKKEEEEKKKHALALLQLNCYTFSYAPQ